MDELFQRGIEEFNRGEYFEAHETWEELWRETRGPERRFYQGLIQAAAGLYHLSYGNRSGATSQLTKAVAKLEEYPAEYSGVRRDLLVPVLRSQAASEGRTGSPPRIHRV